MNVGFFLYLLAVSAEGGGSRARDQIHAIAMTQTIAVTMMDLLPAEPPGNFQIKFFQLTFILRWNTS